MKHVSIEIKARSNKHEKIREFLKSHNADFRGTDHQVDTYFKVGHGRLKLREGNIENYLIYYDRKNGTGPKQSDSILFKSTPGSPLKSILTKANGILSVVDKIREIYFMGNVKFHIDTVQNLGEFIEIEAIGDGEGIEKSKLLEQCNHYLKEFEIEKADIISGSYSDLLLDNL